MVVIEAGAPEDIVPTRDLIPEVRQRTRRRRRRTGMITVALAMIAALGASIAGATRGPATGSRAASGVARSGPILTSTSLGRGTTVGDVQMLSSHSGYGVAYDFTSSHSRFFLVSTSDSASTWRIVAPIEGLGRGNKYFSPSVDFVSARTGYAFSDASNSVVVTVDGGHTWRDLDITNGSAPDSDVTYARTIQQVVVSSQRCEFAVTPPNRCATWLSYFRLGETTPFLTRQIPTFAGAVHWVHLLAAMNPSDVFVAPQVGGRMEESNNNGVSWHAVTTPCPTEPTGVPGQAESPVQLTKFADGAWLLDCMVGVGMSHALNSLWSTTDRGVTWHELSYAGVTTSQGGLMGMAVGFVWSNDHRILFAMWTGANAGVGYSTNGTTWHWTLHDSANGGGQEFLTPIGPEGVLYSSPGDVLAISANGSTWRTLRAQPDVVALMPHGDSVMPASVAAKYRYPIS